MRLFVALDVPDAAVQHLERAVAQVRERHREPRWVPCDRWHVTLAFLGEVGEPQLDPLSERLERAARRHGGFSLSFAGAGRFGNRVVWVGLRGDITPLARLAASVAAAARRAGVPVDDRPHRPHVTLARGRTTSLDLSGVVTALADYGGPRWRADSFSLVRSRLGPQPVYEVLAGYQLGAGMSSD
jgi:RNA 2',3'-cyclic 3'-phosphodiesterase